MGDVKPEPEKTKLTEMSSDGEKKISAVKILFDLNIPVSDSLYNYLTDIELSHKHEKK